MASEFQEVSHLTTPDQSKISLSGRPITPESFRVNLQDADQIQFIFSVNDSQQQQQQPQACCDDDSDSVCFLDGATTDRSSARSESSISADDDGFRTPTSSDHKIPVVEQCPPAPRRPRPISLSRTPSRVSGVRRGFRVVCVSDEIVGSIFSSGFDSVSDLLHQKTKKARKDDNGGEWNLLFNFLLIN